MTDAQKLQALIRKASWFKATDSWNVEVINDRLFVGTETEWHTDEDFGLAKHMYSWQEIIFDKDFARALFDNSKYECCDYSTCEGNREVPLQWWQHKLQQAVISDNPIDYMYKEVFSNEL